MSVQHQQFTLAAIKNVTITKRRREHYDFM